MLIRLIITRVDRDPSICGERTGRALMFKAPEGGPLDRWPVGVCGVEFDDPPKAIGLMRLLIKIKAWIDSMPTRPS